MRILLEDVRYSLRMLRLKPVFAVVAVLTMALGIGVNTTMFGAFEAFLLRPLPFYDPDRLVMVWERHPEMQGIFAERFPVFLEDYRYLSDQAKSFEQMGAFVQVGARFTGTSSPESVEGLRVSADLLNVLGVKLALGRNFAPDETLRGKDQVVILGHDFYTRHLDLGSQVLGQTVKLNDVNYTIIGILPAEFHAPAVLEGNERSNAQFLLPLDLNPPPAAEQNTATNSPVVVARLKTGVAMDQARAEMEALGKHLPADTWTADPSKIGINLFPLRVEDVGRDTAKELLVFQCAIGFVLLIVCANVANLLLARAAERKKEIAVRMALGASRRRVFAQMLTESLTLGALGGSAGLLLAFWCMKAVNQFAPEDVLQGHNLHFDLWVLAFSLATVCMASILFGMAPALHAMRQDVSDALNKTAKSLAAHGWKTLGTLVVSEVSLALVLLVGAGLMARSLVALYRVDLGFSRPDHLLTAHVSLPTRSAGSRYQKPEQVSAFCDQLLERLGNLGGVESATLASALPSVGGGFDVSTFSLPGESKDNNSAGISHVGARYFETVGTRVLRGRTFTSQETEQESDSVIVNQVLAAGLWPNQDPIGKVIVSSKPRTVIGVVEDTRMWGLDQPPKPEIYMPAKALASFSVILRTHGDARSLAASLNSQVLAVDKNMPVESVQTMAEVLDDSLVERRFRTWLFMAFAGLAMSLAAIGLYGVLAYSVNQRLPEIGIRMALGANARDVLKLVVRQGVVLTAWGISVGLFAAFALTRLMSSLVFGIKTNDPLTFVLTAGILMIVAALASYIPARRATRVDPIMALRCE